MATEAQYQNALHNSGGNVNSPMFQQWLATYGGVGQTGSGSGMGIPATGLPPVQGVSDPYGFNQYMLPPQYYQQLTGNISGGMRGEIPADAMNLLAQQAAERGVASGMPGSEAAKYAGLRNLRDVMLNRISQSEQNALGLAGMSSRVLAERERTEQAETNRRRAEDAMRQYTGANLGTASNPIRPYVSSPPTPVTTAKIPTWNTQPTSPYGTGPTFGATYGRETPVTGDWMNMTGWGSGTPSGAANTYDAWLDPMNDYYGGTYQDIYQNIPTASASGQSNFGTYQDWGWPEDYGSFDNSLGDFSDWGWE